MLLILLQKERECSCAKQMFGTVSDSNICSAREWSTIGHFSCWTSKSTQMMQCSDGQPVSKISSISVNVAKGCALPNVNRENLWAQGLGLPAGKIYRALGRSVNVGVVHVLAHQEGGCSWQHRGTFLMFVKLSDTFLSILRQWQKCCKHFCKMLVSFSDQNLRRKLLQKLKSGISCFHRHWAVWNHPQKNEYGLGNNKYTSLERF